MDKVKNSQDSTHPDEYLGFLVWQLEEIENFYPCYKTMIKRD